MIILTNGLTDKTDEGFLKVANSLIRRLKKADSSIKTVSYERRSELTDEFIKVNKFMSGRAVRDICRKEKDVLYVPFPTRKWVMALRVFILSRFTCRLRVILVLKTPVNPVSRFLLRKSGAEIIVFSEDAAAFYGDIVGKDRVTYLKTGVDTGIFRPVSPDECRALKVKYGFEPDEKVVLHVGHMNEGRNIRELMKIGPGYRVLLVTSTFTQSEADEKLRQALLSRPNIKIISDYIPHIEEVYRLSDVYFFPVTDEGHCIDVPLSCLEAAACGKPVVTTSYGEMKRLADKPGFFLLKDFSAETVNETIAAAIGGPAPSSFCVDEYDWDRAVSFFLG